MSDWKTLFKTTEPVKNIEGAERRLNDTIESILKRWITEEKQSGQSMIRKLSVSLQTLEKLIVHFDLKKQYDANKKHNRKQSAAFKI